jgi:hypothetical protein
MATEETREEPAPLAANPEGHLVTFLPHLRLKSSHRVGGVEFVPLRGEDGTVSSSLESVARPLDKVLSGYVDRKGKALTNCVVATIPGRGWDLDRADFDTLRWAVSLLFLGSWSRNEYFPRFGGHYVNSSQFRVVGQAYSGGLPHYITLTSRRRDGSTTDGGYKHGELRFHLPVQVSLRDFSDVDDALLGAIDRASMAGSPTVARLRAALPFVELANSDDDFMTPHNEAILMGSAFEQLLDADAKKHKLGTTFAGLLQEFGSVTVREAHKVRPNILIDQTDPARAAAQPNWWVHQKWIEELYDVRSKVVHKGSAAVRSWGWSVFEHLVMAAHVFPLTVKLMLSTEGHYTLTQDDQVRCLIVDKLLASARWVDAYDDDDDEAPLGSDESWTRILSATRSRLAFAKAWSSVRDNRPELFEPESGE